MGTHKSADKAHRQSLTRQAANRTNTSRLRTEIKKIRESAKAGDADTAGKMLANTLSLIDKSVQKGVMHRNAAARNKSRITRLVRGVSAKA